MMQAGHGMEHCSGFLCCVCGQCGIITNVVAVRSQTLAQCCKMKFTTWIGGHWEVGTGLLFRDTCMLSPN